MKQIIAMLAVGLVAVTASAEPSYGIVNTVAYAKDANPSDANAGHYSGYLCTVESASTYFGGNTSAAGLTSYVSANYDTVLASLFEATKNAGIGGAIGESGVLRLAADSEGYTAGQYAVSAYSASALGSEYLALILYNDGQNQAFRAFEWGNAESSGAYVAFDDDGSAAASAARGYGAWTIAVPEPTGGLLLLLGVAGLALKRKRT